MSVKHQNWRWRNRRPRCDQCGGSDTHRLRVEVDWKEQMTKSTWKCAHCANHVFVYSYKKQNPQAA